MADAQEDFEKSRRTYQMLHENERFLVTRANFVAQSLDRFDRLGAKAPRRS